MPVPPGNPVGSDSPGSRPDGAREVGRIPGRGMWFVHNSGSSFRTSCARVSKAENFAATDLAIDASPDLRAGQREHNRDVAGDQAESSTRRPSRSPGKTLVHGPPTPHILCHPFASSWACILQKKSPEPFAPCVPQGPERITDPFDHHLLQGTRRASL
jgi:hypothetical protein